MLAAVDAGNSALHGCASSDPSECDGDGRCVCNDSTLHAEVHERDGLCGSVRVLGAERESGVSAVGVRRPSAVHSERRLVR